jgi:RimJ/RimL family protein N-acetyltransferase
MDLQPTLENELIMLRPLQSNDKEALYEAANDPKIWEQHPNKRNLRPVFEKFFEESIESKGALVILDKQINEIIGSSRYKTYEGFPNAVEIGWTFLSRSYWGGEYNRSVKSLMMNHAFQYMDHIIFHVDKHNIRSQRALEKIQGRKIEGSEIEKFPPTREENLTFVISKV